MVSKDGSAAICARTPSSKPAGNKGAGWLHFLNDTQNWRACFRPIYNKAPTATTSGVDMEAIARRYTAAVTAQQIERFADELGVTDESLRRLGLGWSAGEGAWSFPMRDASGRIIGISLRKPGFKYAVKGSRLGLFLPADVDAAGQLFVCEGASDTAALLDLGLDAVGRPSCTSGVPLLVELVRARRTAEVVIVADGDQPSQDGARRLAEALETLPIELCIVTPPTGIKDAREWKRQRAVAADIVSGQLVNYPHPAIRRARRHAIAHRAKQRRHSV